MKPQVTFGVLSVLMTGIVSAQAVSSADVNIVSIDAKNEPKRFVCTAVINNQNDDDSRATTVIVLMPLQVTNLHGRVLGGKGSCKAFSNSSFSEVEICDLGHLPQGPTVKRTVEVTSTLSTAPSSIPSTCSAFVYSLVGDIDKTNNYKWATAP